MEAGELKEWIRREGRWEFSRSSGPGGQNVNKLSTKATLRLPLDHLPVTDHQRQAVRKRLSNRVTSEGELVIHASQMRSQHANRRLALQRAVALLNTALARKKPRLATRPSRAAIERRIVQKKRRGELKRERRRPEC